MSRLLLAFAMLPFAVGGLDSGWNGLSLHSSMFTNAPRYGRKPSGAAAAKRAAKRRRNITKRLPK